MRSNDKGTNKSTCHTFQVTVKQKINNDKGLGQLE